MIYQYITLCEHCGEEEEFISTSDTVSCGRCGKESKITSQKTIVQEKHED